MASRFRQVPSPSLVLMFASMFGVAYGLGCGGSSNDSDFPGGKGVGGDGGGDSSIMFNGGDGGDGSTGLKSNLVISPLNPVLNVTIANGVVTAMPVDFSVTANGQAVQPTWAIDRPELGSVTALGVFTASGGSGGVGNVTATFGGSSASTTITINVVSKSSGANATSGIGVQVPDAMGQPPAGGYNGVGGVVLGTAPTTQVSALLDGTATTNAGFSWLYPYNNTVWPRGMLAPLLQWAIPSGFNGTAVRVHLKEANYEFTGYYAGSNLINQPVDEAVWTQATLSNGGDPLLIDLTITDGTHVYGPISESWTVAPGALQGTVYYATYNSQLNGPVQNASDGNGAVLAIKPGASAPTLAIPALYGQCHVCHEVSNNGSTLFTDDTSLGDYGDAYSYNLTQSPAKVDQTYTSSQTLGEFTFSAPYPDGTFALANSQVNFHAYAGNSTLFERDTSQEIASTGFKDKVTEAVTPAFSPDGTKVAFNFWAGPGGNGVTAGGGNNLTLMDFSCGATSGGACGAPPYTFSNLRQMYQDTTTNHYVGWPVFTPDSANVVFQRTITPTGGSGANPQSDSPLNTRAGAQAEMWIASATTGTTTPAYAPMPLCQLNGLASDCKTQTIPTNSVHPNDTILNFEPTITPVASGGYFWVMFTSRRLYGNVATLDPYYPVQGQGADPTIPVAKKLWIAAIDMNPKAGVDPSHPAFYLPAQELVSGNSRGYWVNDPCQQNGTSCATGNECCSGYCNDSSSSSTSTGPGSTVLTCGPKPAGCSQEYDKCESTADCCAGEMLQCTGGYCVLQGPK